MITKEQLIDIGFEQTKHGGPNEYYYVYSNVQRLRVILYDVILRTDFICGFGHIPFKVDTIQELKILVKMLKS